MVGRLDFYKKQTVTSAQLNLAFQFFEDALLNASIDLDLEGFVVGGNSNEQSPTAFGIELPGPSIGYDFNGRRFTYETDQEIDLTEDRDSEPTTVVTPGNTKWLTVTAFFSPILSDLQPVPPAPFPGFFLVAAPGFAIRVTQGVEDVAPVKPVIGGFEIIVCDVLIAFGQVIILNADIDVSRKVTFTGPAPGLHASDHESGGIDEIQHDSLVGAGSNTHAQIDTHIADSANPHATSFANLGTTNLAALNALITDANLDDLGDPRTPIAHNTSHQHGGSDEIASATPGNNVIVKANAFALLEDGWFATTNITQHESAITHQNISGAGSNDHSAIDGHLGSTSNPHNTSLANLISGNLAALNALVSDAVLDDTGTPRTPLGHKASHKHGGGDEVASATPAANEIPKALGTGFLDQGWMVIGSEFQFVERLTELGTTVGPMPTSLEYLSLTTPTIPAGTYRIGWMAIWSMSDNTDDFQLRIQVDNSINIIDPSNGGFMNQEPADAGTDQRHASSGFRYVVLTNAVHDIDMDFADGGGGTATIYHGVIELWRVA